MTIEILNSKGEPIVLTPMANEYANQMQAQYDELGREKKNALGGEISFTTLTAVQTKVLEQKFFTVSPADFVPIIVGNGAWAEQLLTFREYSLNTDFENGVINTSTDFSRLAKDSVGLDSIVIPTVKWAKAVDWTIPELATATRTGNWNIVESKERTRKRGWDLGIQRVAFLGMGNVAATKIYGLLNQPEVSSNTTLITTAISAMTADQFSTFAGGIMGAYQANSAYTVMPDTFLMPQSDFNALAVPSSSTNPFRTRIEILREAFALVTGNQNFVIRGIPYADKTNVEAIKAGLTVNRYVLYRRDQDALRMEMPVDYTQTAAGTFNNFQFQNVAYGNFTGTYAYRPMEMLYFDRA